jgi:EmrB/QacA subfamily drug resistance transporter
MLEAATPHHVARPRPRPCEPPDSDPRWSLVVAILGSTMAFVDGTVVNIALPVMQRELGAGVDRMQWVVEAYALLLASLVLVGGALGDRVGRKRAFTTGVALFAIASALCAVAPGIEWLIAARALQGVGGALLVPGSLALIGAAYHGEARGAAIGTWSAVTAVASAAGPVLGGWIVAHASWRWLFIVNVPVGLLVVSLASRRVAETRDPEAATTIDFAGAALATIGLGAITWALLEAPAFGGLTAPATLVVLLGGLATLVAFVRVESKAVAPMVPLALFRSRTFAAANLATLFLYAALGACLFFLPFNLIEVQGYPPPIAGAALLPFVALISVLSRRSGAWAAQHGARGPLVVGPLTSAVGFALLAVPSTGGTYVAGFMPGIVVLGIGMGVTVAPLTTAVMESVDERHAGTASGINNAVARAASLLAIAGLGVVLQAEFNRSLDHSIATLGLPDAARGMLEGERTKLAAAAIPPGLGGPAREAVREAIDAAFVAGFRSLMFAGAALATLAAGASALLVQGQLPPRSRAGHEDRAAGAGAGRVQSRHGQVEHEPPGHRVVGADHELGGVAFGPDGGNRVGSQGHVGPG